MPSSMSSPLDRPVHYVKDERLAEAELAYIDSCQKRVAEWADANLFTPKLVLERLTEESQREVEHLFEGLRSTFSQATAKSSQADLDEATFTTLINQKIALPSPISQEVGPILFDILAYASSLPFPSPTPPARLNLDAVTRGVAILSPSLNPLSRGDESSYCVVSRRRTQQDARRIIFQGLASPGLHNEEKPSAPETGDAISCNSEYFFLDVSAEDARTTDLLDALVVSQPEQTPYTSNVARCFFKDVAATLLKAETPQQRETLYSQQVSKQRFGAVLKLTLALQALKSAPVVVAEVEREAGRLMENVFFQPGAESVGWKRFDEGLRRLRWVLQFLCFFWPEYADW
ncbi:hypothetical protein BDZ97DRAFT_1916474 [Flammula alnicola]|nr:hypothetical protein BDZ97DRAFT_1916474 [Flammula alnicola]